MTDIYNNTQLQNINSDLSGDHVLKNDLDLEGVSWVPIGGASPFTGTFDGDGYTISNLTLDDSAGVYTDGVGLFGNASGTIQNLNLSNFTITGQNKVGALVGNLFGGTIHKCCSLEGSVTGLVSKAGGLVGYMSSDPMIQNCYATSDVVGVDYVGGLLGRSEGGVILNSYFAGSSVTGDSNVGGMIGNITVSGVAASDTTIINIYAVSSVSGTSNVGGLIGSIDG